MTIEFSLTHFIKEAQQQHGLQTEDYARYHHYLTKRVAALRQQLHLSNEKTRFLHKEVTAANATDARHLMLLALYTERCFAAAETLQERWQAGQQRGNTDSRSAGGFPPHDQYRKRFNKAVKWATELTHIARTAGSAELQEECEAYGLESRGRAGVAHGNLSEAKKVFVRARELYTRRYRDAKTLPTTADTLRMKVSELSDRIVYCQQRLGEEMSAARDAGAAAVANAHTPTRSAKMATPTGNCVGEDAVRERWDHHSVEEGDHDNNHDDAIDARMTTLCWNGRALRLTGMKVRGALREARSVGVEVAEVKALESAGMIIPVGQVNKVLELMDRRISNYNDALAHAQQDLRAGGGEMSALKTEQQLIVHYFLFAVANEQVRRALFLARVYERRFYATERALRHPPATASSSSSAALSTPRDRQEGDAHEEECDDGWMAKVTALRAHGAAHAHKHSLDRGLLPAHAKSRKSELPPAQYASPLEVIHLYRTAGEALAKMELLPGVSHRADVQKLRAVCEAGQRLFAGEGWRVSGEEDKARACYQRALSVVDEAMSLGDGDDDDSGHRRSSDAGIRAASEQAARMRDRVQCALLRSTAAVHAAAHRPASSSPTPRYVNYWTDVGDDGVVAARNVVRFPPSLQAIPCKPAFIDIVGTFIHYPQWPSSSGLGGGVELPLTQCAKAASQTKLPARATTGQAGVGAAWQNDGPFARTDNAGDDKNSGSSSPQGGKRWPWKWGWG